MKRILLLAALNVAIVFNANAYDFSAVASSGQTLYYNISGTNVTLTYPGSYGNPYPSGGPTGSLTRSRRERYGSPTPRADSAPSARRTRCIRAASTRGTP